MFEYLKMSEGDQKVDQSASLLSSNLKNSSSMASDFTLTQSLFHVLLALSTKVELTCEFTPVFV